MEPRFQHNFSQLPLHENPPQPTLAGLKIGLPGDRFEREADHNAERVVRSTLPTEGEQASWHGGHDLSRVRLHVDDGAAESANAVNAKAYTVGQHIVFGRGQYNPETSEGQKLLAHELAHTVQQSRRQSTPGTLIQRTPAEDSSRGKSPALAKTESQASGKQVTKAGPILSSPSGSMQQGGPGFSFEREYLSKFAYGFAPNYLMVAQFSLGLSATLAAEDAIVIVKPDGMDIKLGKNVTISWSGEPGSINSSISGAFGEHFKVGYELGAIYDKVTISESFALRKTENTEIENEIKIEIYFFSWKTVRNLVIAAVALDLVLSLLAPPLAAFLASLIAEIAEGGEAMLLGRISAAAVH